MSLPTSEFQDFVFSCSCVGMGQPVAVGYEVCSPEAGCQVEVLGYLGSEGFRTHCVCQMLGAAS